MKIIQYICFFFRIVCQPIVLPTGLSGSQESTRSNSLISINSRVHAVPRMRLASSLLALQSSSTLQAVRSSSTIRATPGAAHERCPLAISNSAKTRELAFHSTLSLCLMRSETFQTERSLVCSKNAWIKVILLMSIPSYADLTNRPSSEVGRCSYVGLLGRVWEDNPICKICFEK